MTFGTPQALWFFVLVPFFVLLHYRSFSDMGRMQRAISLALRMVVLTAIILALSDARLIERSDKLAVFFLWDASHSVGEGSAGEMAEYIQAAVAGADKERDSAGLIAFGRDAFVEEGLDSDLSEIGAIESDIAPNFTDVAGAVDLALASLPPDVGARIVLLSDGNENLGDALTSARIAANRGVEIDAVPFGQPTSGEVVAGRLILPRRVEEDETFDVRAVIEAESEGDAVVEVYENDELIGAQEVHLVPGKNVFTFPRQQEEGGFYAYRVQVRAPSDIEAANNTATDYTIVQGKPRVCFVSGDPNERPYLVNALQAEGIVAEFRDLSGLPTSLVDMAPYHVIFFSDVGGELLMPDTMTAYQSYVRDLGGGFAMVGGENSFGPGGYFRTPIEEMLPVDLDITKKGYMPSIGICLVVDKSGSMGCTEMGGEQKIEIAKVACAAVVELLDYTDQVGVVAFDGAGHWVVDMMEVTNKDYIIDRIGTMRAGGGTSVYAGMQIGFTQLRTADTRIRHMIVLSDGITAPGGFDRLVRDMNAYDITVTTISVGSDANLQLMRNIANWGGGNHYECNSIHQVPQIFTKETFLATNRAIVDEAFRALENMISPVTEGIDWRGSPTLLGYVATNIKPLATEALTTHRTDPLLAHWQYGLGRSLAFTSDVKARWAASWLLWPGYKQVWTQATRWLVGGAMAGNLVPNVYLRAGKAHISVDAIDSSGEMITDALLRARIVLPDMEVLEMDLFQVAPGRYEAAVDATQIGSYLVNIFQEDEEANVVDQISSGFSVSYPPEYEQSGPNLFMLAQLTDATGGVLGLSPTEVFRHTNQPINRYLDLWYYLLILAICLLPIDIAVRRLSLTGESIQYVRQRVGEAVASVISAQARIRAQPTHIEHLKKIKERYRLDAARETELADREVDRRVSEILAGTAGQRRGEEPADADADAEVIRRRVAKRLKREPEPTESSLARLKKVKKRLWGKEDEPDSRG